MKKSNEDILMETWPSINLGCTKELSSGATGTGYKVCDHGCKQCRIAKVGKFEGALDPLEAAFDYNANEVVKGTPYKYLVSKFIDFVRTPDHREVLYSEFNDNHGDMESFMSTRWQTIEVSQFASLLLEIFATLDYLHTHMGFLHMDLKLDNVLVIDATPESRFPLGDGTRVQRAPGVKYSAMVIDYGNGYARADSSRTFEGKIWPNSEIYAAGSTDFAGKCYYPAFDVIRLFFWLYEIRNTCSPKLSAFIEKCTDLMFNGHIDALSRYRNRYYMLDKDGCVVMKKLIDEGNIILRTYGEACWHICNTPGSDCTLASGPSAPPAPSAPARPASGKRKTSHPAAPFASPTARQKSKTKVQLLASPLKSPHKKRRKNICNSFFCSANSLSAGQISKRRRQKKGIYSIENASMSRYR